MNRAGRILSLVIKLLVLVAIVAIGVIIYQTCAGTPLIQRIDKTVPDKMVAPFEVPTVTKSYLAQEAALNDDGSVTMSGWYERDGDRWVLHEEVVTLPPVLRPRVNRR